MKKWIIVAGALVVLTLAVWAGVVWFGGETSVPAGQPADDDNTDDGRILPVIRVVEANARKIGRFEKLELVVDLTADYDNPYDPDELDLSAEFTSPAGLTWRINGFFDAYPQTWKVRFSPDETGEWTYRLRVRDRQGETEGGEGRFAVTASNHKGWVTLSDDNPRFLSYRDGTGFYGVGVAYPWGITEHGLDQIAAAGGNLVTYWNGNYDHAGRGGGKNQLASVQFGIGKIDPLKARRIDELLEAFEKRDLHMNFVIWPHDSLADNIPGWPATWQDSAFSLLGEAKDFYDSEEMWAYQEKMYRYIIARWGHSRALGIWDLIVEINGTDGWAYGKQDEANDWAARIHAYFKENDPYGHPTMGSMAGNRQDFWDFGYQIFDLADRENYYDLHYRAYAEDIRERWSRYEKPLMIGETGNVGDAAIYHDALWVSLASGLASAPMWWDFSQIGDDVLAQMRAFSDFVRDIDFTEQRTPVVMAGGIVEVPVASSVSIVDGTVDNDWGMPDWAEANKDADGRGYAVAADGDGVSLQMRFATGGFAQGYVQQTPRVKDWSGYDELVVDIMAEHDGGEPLWARPVLLPDYNWTEGDDMSDVELPPGRWVTLRVPLADLPDGYWRDGKQMTEQQLANMSQWGVKVYQLSTPNKAEPATIWIRDARLANKTAKTARVPEAEGWLMAGAEMSYGWMVTEVGAIGGKSVIAADLPDGPVTVAWTDPWTGREIGRDELVVRGGKLTLQAPETDQRDVAFKLHHLR